MTKLVSVVMSTYNESLIELDLAVESIINQTHKNIEFLIVLDNPENYLIKEKLETYQQKDKRIKLLYNKKNVGLTHSLNKAIKKSNGEFIVRMDADDISFEHRIEKQLNYIEEKNLGLISANKIFIDEKGKKIGKPSELPTTTNNIKKRLNFSNIIGHPAVMIRKNVFEKVGYYRDIHTAEDYDLWLRMARLKIPMGIIAEPLIYYRIREKSISNSQRYKQFLTTEYLRSLNRRTKFGLKDNYTSEHLEEYLCKNELYSSKGNDRFSECKKYILQTKNNIEKRDFFSAIKTSVKAYRKNENYSKYMIKNKLVSYLYNE